MGSAKSLIVIPCCGRKRPGGHAGCMWTPERSAVARLSPASASALLSARRELAEMLGYPAGTDLGNGSGVSVPLMQARERYVGNLYGRVQPALWPSEPADAGVEVVIVSALYGLLTPWEPIREYDAWMGKSIGVRVRLGRWWKEHSLGRLLAEYVTRSGAAVVHDFLSGPYSAAGRDLDSLDGVEVVRHKYPGLGTGSDYHRGKDVSTLLRAVV